jgi:hypothetical protein
LVSCGDQVRRHSSLVMLCDYFCCIAMIYLEISRLLAQERGEMGGVYDEICPISAFCRSGSSRTANIGRRQAHTTTSYTKQLIVDVFDRRWSLTWPDLSSQSREDGEKTETRKKLK